MMERNRKPMPIWAILYTQPAAFPIYISTAFVTTPDIRNKNMTVPDGTLSRILNPLYPYYS